MGRTERPQQRLSKVLRLSQTPHQASRALLSPTPPKKAQAAKAPVWIKAHLLHEATPDSSSLWRPHPFLSCPVFPRAPTPGITVHCLVPLHAAENTWRHIFRHLPKHLETSVGLSAWHKVGWGELKMRD